MTIYMAAQKQRQRSTANIGVNPVRFGWPHILGWGRGESWALHEILYPMVYRNLRWKHFPKWQLLRNRKIFCTLIKNSSDDSFNPVLRVSICWTFRTHNPTHPEFKPKPPTPSVSLPGKVSMFRQMVSLVRNDWKPTWNDWEPTGNDVKGDNHKR